MSGSQWGGATAENEAHANIWVFSEFGGIVCDYQIAVVCEFDLLQYVFYLKCQVIELLPVCMRMMWIFGNTRGTENVCEVFQRWGLVL